MPRTIFYHCLRRLFYAVRFFEKSCQEKCASCHKLDDKLVGPPLKDVTKRRKPEWILNMILNPEQMTKENAAAKQLLGQYLTQMTFQNVSINDAYAILEYLRVQDGEK